METPKSQSVTPKRDSFKLRLGKKHADKQFDDDEALFGQINDDYDEYDNQLSERDKQLEEYKGREKVFSDMFTGDPRKAKFMQAWKDGEDPTIAMIRQFGPEFEDVLHDESKQEEIAAANKEYAERVAQEMQYEEEYQKNLQQSIDNISALEKNGVDSEKLDAAFGLLIGIVRDGLMGKFSPESIEMAMKAINHDTDVESAASDAEVKGRNAKIDEKLRKSKKGDGTSPLGGKNGGAAQQKPKAELGPLEHYGEGASTIWERGNEKRTKY